MAAVLRDVLLSNNATTSSNCSCHSFLYRAPTVMGSVDRSRQGPPADAPASQREWDRVLCCAFLREKLGGSVDHIHDYLEEARRLAAEVSAVSCGGDVPDVASRGEETGEARLVASARCLSDHDLFRKGRGGAVALGAALSQSSDSRGLNSHTSPSSACFVPLHEAPEAQDPSQHSGGQAAPVVWDQGYGAPSVPSLAELMSGLTAAMGLQAAVLLPLPPEFHERSKFQRTSMGTPVVVPQTSEPQRGRGLIAASSPGAPSGDEVWDLLRGEALHDAEAEPVLASYLHTTILSHRTLEAALASHLANKLASPTLLSMHVMALFRDVLSSHPEVGAAVRRDIVAVKTRDPACITHLHCFLNFKGFQALQAHRVAHELWRGGRHSLALALHSRAAEVFHVDIHPGARFGSGVLLDHGTGIVVGETAVVGDEVTMLHSVTLGGSGIQTDARHPIVEDGVMMGAGAKALGRVIIGKGAKVGACSVVTTDVSPGATVVGNPAREVVRRVSKTASSQAL